MSLEAKGWDRKEVAIAKDADTEDIEAERSARLQGVAEKHGMEIEDLNSLNVVFDGKTNVLIEGRVNGAAIQITHPFSDEAAGTLDGNDLTARDVFLVAQHLHNAVIDRNGVNWKARGSTVEQLKQTIDYENNVGKLRDRVLGIDRAFGQVGLGENDLHTLRALCGCAISIEGENVVIDISHQYEGGRKKHASESKIILSPRDRVEWIAHGSGSIPPTRFEVAVFRGGGDSYMDNYTFELKSEERE